MRAFINWLRVECLAIWRALTTDRDRYEDGASAAEEFVIMADDNEIIKAIYNFECGLRYDIEMNNVVDDFDYGWIDTCQEELHRRREFRK